ncbi:hypothetical protein ACELLULO517_07140 [Acidisoma cellulosilytica]|uniref:Calcium-binding protein n=1 Tax=Acidisoma cellulosilyticum TaxID=2802395 RepID=A0A963YZG3_9PROT|nr:hypothetical protein [Acidisoma cellulosilyticum]MCB8880003.1 hypothetical protein [Acidisoma cellulosilyticum]
MSDTANTAPSVSYFTVGGHPLVQSDPNTGLYTAAVVDDSGQLVVTFESSHLDSGNTGFTVDPLASSPSAQQPALDLTQTGLADAEAAGYSPRDIILSGQSAGASATDQAAAQAVLPASGSDTPPLTFIGGSGAISVMRDGGAVTLYGAAGNTAQTLLEGGSGATHIHGGTGATTVTASVGASTLTGDAIHGLMLAQGDGTDAILVSAGAGTVLAAGGAGIDGAGSHVYDFVDGHTGVGDILGSLTALESLTFGSGPIASDGASLGSDLITLSDGTVIQLAGIDRNIFS